MEVPKAIYTECSLCGEETLHRVIKGSLGEKKSLVLDALVKCKKCGHKHTCIIRAAKQKVIPVIISEQDISQKSELEISPTDTVLVDDEYQTKSGVIKITAIETESSRVNSATAKDIKTLWAKKFDKIKLKISINKVAKTFTRTVWAVPDEEFFIGDVMTIKGLSFTIHSIKTKDRRIKRGSVEARDIVRLYGKVVR